MNVGLLRNRVFAGDRVRMRSLQWALVHYAGALMKTQNLGTETHTGQKPMLLYNLKGTSPADTLIRISPEMRDSIFLLFKLPSLWYLVTAALAK